MAERLILVRHGECEGSGFGRLRGRADLPLTARGRAQAQALASVLPLRDQDVACFTSPLSRARDTAELALVGSGLAAAVMPELGEIDAGEWEGMTYAEAAQRDPDQAARWAAWDLWFAFPSGERLRDFIDRVGQACDRLVACPQPTVIAFTHGGVVRVALCRLLGLDSRQYLLFDVGPACVASVHLYGDLGVLTGLHNSGLAGGEPA